MCTDFFPFRIFISITVHVIVIAAFSLCLSFFLRDSTTHTRTHTHTRVQRNAQKALLWRPRVRLVNIYDITHVREHE